SKKGTTPRTTPKSKKEAIPKAQPQASQKHEVPFGAYDNILLVGEGDFSFAHSLCTEHGCANVTATSFDAGEDVEIKYSQFEKIQSDLLELTPPVPIHHSIDATKLSAYKSLRHKNEDGNEEPWDTVAFMFPHTGGLSTDVNRQVRANQALLVGFFESCLEMKSTKPSAAGVQAKDGPAPQKKKKKNSSGRMPFLKVGGKVIVTLFEGSPYTLWNVRDLARHTGLKVVESFKFCFADYPGYSHVRTLGTIKGDGGWKGEEREARMYVFEKVATEPEQGEEKAGLKENAARKKMRNGDGLKRGRESDEDEED
ncbi:hypothetical protein K504DRAFT_333012, partial [Pleomassaria siparia CBS 279.74]